MSHSEQQGQTPKEMPDRSDRLVPLCTCANAVEASVIRNRLLADGIPAHVQGAEVATMLSYVGTAIETVRVEVSEDDLPRALQVLDQDRQSAKSRTQWTCSRCGEFNEPTFDICWSCNKARDPGDQAPEALPQVVNEPDQMLEPIAGYSRESKTDSRHSNPYHPPVTDQQTPFTNQLEKSQPSLPSNPSPSQPKVPHEFSDSMQQEAVEILTRAWRASILGVFLIPPMLHLYSLHLLLFRFPPTDPTPGRLKLKRIGLIAINLLAVLISWMWWKQLVS